jgi:hypothetical protein
MPKKSLLPFIILGSGFVWFGLCAWIRRRLSRPDPASGVTPGTPALVLAGVAGLIVCMIAAAVVAYVKWS